MVQICSVASVGGREAVVMQVARRFAGAARKNHRPLPLRGWKHRSRHGDQRKLVTNERSGSSRREEKRKMVRQR
jgi:hypothetical protein